MRQPRFGGRIATPQVADQCLAQFRRSVGGAIGAKPAAERAHHSPDLLADDHVAKTDLAHLPIHVVHEQFGELDARERSEKHTSELQSLMRNSYAVFSLQKKTTHTHTI